MECDRKESRMDSLVGYILLIGVLASALFLIVGIAMKWAGAIDWGIKLLLFTPYVRVVASVFYFAFAERNMKYTAFTGFVLAVLTYSLFLH